MSREEFLRQLEQELHALSQEEKNNAMQFYRDYLYDADDVEEAINNLGSPQKVAADILRELGAVPAQVQSSKNERLFSNLDRGQKFLLTALIVIAAVSIIPAVFSGVGGIVFAAVILLVFLFPFFFLLSMFFFGYGLCLLYWMCMEISAGGASALVMLGGSIVSISLGLLFFAAFLWLLKTVFPSIIRGIVSLCQRILGLFGGKTQ